MKKYNYPTATIILLIAMIISCKKSSTPPANNSVNNGKLVFYIYDPVMNYPAIKPITDAKIGISDNYTNGLNEVYSQTITTNSQGTATFNNFPYSQGKFYSVIVDDGVYDYHDLVGFSFNKPVDTIWVAVTQ